jgi:hypothetical protein
MKVSFLVLNGQPPYMLDDSSSVSSDTLKYKRMGTVLENKRVLPMNQTDSVIINWQ